MALQLKPPEWDTTIKSVLPTGSPMVAVIEGVGAVKEEGFSVKQSIFILPWNYMVQGRDVTVQFWHKIHGQAC